MSEDCPHCVFEKTEANCRGCFEGSHYKPKPITNDARIRSMTDEELAEFMRKGCDDRECPDISFPADTPFAKDASNEQCRKCWLDWLKQEVTDDP